MLADFKLVGDARSPTGLIGEKSLILDRWDRISDQVDNRKKRKCRYENRIRFYGEMLSELDFVESYTVSY